jgi:hypothetical protein
MISSEVCATSGGTRVKLTTDPVARAIRPGLSTPYCRVRHCKHGDRTVWTREVFRRASKWRPAGGRADRQLVEDNRGFRDCGLPIGFPAEGNMKTQTLSESAVALLRFRVKGWPIKAVRCELALYADSERGSYFRSDDLGAFRERSLQNP